MKNINVIDNRNSNILLITICSNSKLRGGESKYNPNKSFLSLLENHSKELLTRRQKVYKLLKSREPKRDGMDIKDLPFNQNLNLGRDLGGTASAEYMPAYKRYTGRFYKELIISGKSLLQTTKHHTLIISSLYGLLLPQEMIQTYSCHLPDYDGIVSVWEKDNFVTSLVLAYIRHFKIKLVFDLTAQEIYRNLINWERVRKKSSVLHAFGEQNAGPATLPALGTFARKNLLNKSNEELLVLPANKSFYSKYESIKLFETRFPPDGFPRETPRKDISPSNHDNEKEKSQKKSPNHVILDHEVEILNHYRDIRIVSRDHNTIFDKNINFFKDLPISVQPIFQEISRCPDVIEVLFGRFKPKGPKSKTFKIKLSIPNKDTSHIYAKLLGKGKIGGTQEIDIRVTKGREMSVYKSLNIALKEYGA